MGTPRLSGWAEKREIVLREDGEREWKQRNLRSPFSHRACRATDMLLQHGCVGINPSPTVLEYLWHAVSCHLIRPIDILRRLGSNRGFGAVEDELRYGLLLELMFDNLATVGVSFSGDQHPEHPLLLCAALVEALAALMVGARTSAKLGHDRNVELAVRMCRRILEATRTRMLVVVGKHESADCWARVLSAWDELKSSAARSAAELAQLDELVWSVETNGRPAWAAGCTPGPNPAVKTGCSAVAPAPPPARLVWDSVPFKALAYFEATRQYCPLTDRALQWGCLMKCERRSLAEVLGLLWSIGLQRLGQTSGRATVRWSHFLCVQVPLLASSIATEALGMEPSKIHQLTELALSRLEIESKPLLKRGGEVLGCNMHEELTTGCVKQQLLPLQQSPSQQHLMTLDDCIAQVRRLEHGGAETDWTAVNEGIEEVLKLNMVRLCEGLYAHNQLIEFHHGLLAVCSAAKRSSDANAASSFNSCQVLARYLELEYLLPLRRAEWAQGNVDEGLAGEILHEAFHDVSGPRPAPTPGISPLCTTAAQRGVGSLAGIGRWIGAQLVAAESAGFCTPEQFSYGLRQIENQLPAVALDTVDWLTHGLPSDVVQDDVDAQVRLKILVEFRMAAHGLADGFDLEAEDCQPQNRLAVLLQSVLEACCTPVFNRSLGSLSLHPRVRLENLPVGIRPGVARARAAGPDTRAELESIGEKAILALRGSNRRLNPEAVHDMIRAAQTCGIGWFAQAAAEEITTSHRIDYVVLVAEVTAVVVVLADGPRLPQSARHLFSKVLSWSCRRMSTCAQAVGLARLVLQLIAIMIESLSRSSTATTEPDIDPLRPAKRRRSELSDPAVELNLLLEVMLTVLDEEPSPALAFPLSLAEQAAALFGPAGMLPHAAVGDELRDLRMQIAMKLRLFGKLELVR